MNDRVLRHDADGLCTLTLNIDLLAPEGRLDALGGGLYADILVNSWRTCFATKRLMRETDSMPLADALAHEHYRHPGHAPDHQERIARFSRK